MEYLDDAAAMAPGCVVADIRMPELDGIGLSQAMRSRGIDAPIVFMTATGDVDTVVRAMRAERVRSAGEAVHRGCAARRRDACNRCWVTASMTSIARCWRCGGWQDD